MSRRSYHVGLRSRREFHCHFLIGTLNIIMTEVDYRFSRETRKLLFSSCCFHLRRGLPDDFMYSELNFYRTSLHL